MVDAAARTATLLLLLRWTATPLLLVMVAVYALALRIYGRRMGRQMRAVRDD